MHGCMTAPGPLTNMATQPNAYLLISTPALNCALIAVLARRLSAPVHASP